MISSLSSVRSTEPGSAFSSCPSPTYVVDRNGHLPGGIRRLSNHSICVNFLAAIDHQICSPVEVSDIPQMAFGSEWTIPKRQQRGKNVSSEAVRGPNGVFWLPQEAQVDCGPQDAATRGISAAHTLAQPELKSLQNVGADAEGDPLGGLFHRITREMCVARSSPPGGDREAGR